MSSPIAGAWKMVSDSVDGIAVFSDSYFSIVISEKNRAKFKAEEPTEAEAAKAFHAVSTAAGRYELSGTTLVCHRIANLNPNRAGMDGSFEITLAGDRLTMKGGESDDPTWVWTKVE
jgi:hypothetical protein